MPNTTSTPTRPLRPLLVFLALSAMVAALLGAIVATGTAQAAPGPQETVPGCLAATVSGYTDRTTDPLLTGIGEQLTRTGGPLMSPGCPVPAALVSMIPGLRDRTPPPLRRVRAHADAPRGVVILREGQWEARA